MKTYAESLSTKARSCLIQAATMGVIALVGVGCAVGKDSNLSGACAGASAEALQAQNDAFAKTLHPVFGKNTCNTCHDGSGKAPYSFAASDASTALPSALKLVDLQSPASSRFISKVGTEMHQCGTDSSKCQAIANEMKTQIEAWAAQTKDIEVPRCDIVGILLTSTTTKAITQADLAGGATKTYRWDMNGASVGLGNVWFQIEGKLFQPPAGDSNGVYVLKGPVVASSTKRLRVGAIQFTINGKLDASYSNFVGTNFIIDSGPFDINSPNWDFPYVTNAQQMVAWEGSAGDNIGVQVVVQPTEEPADTLLDDYICYERSNFNANVLPILNNRCTSCHAMVGNPAIDAYPLFATGDQCAETLKKVNFSSPTSSLIFRKARDASGHPGGSPLSGRTAEINAIINWIQAEGTHH